MLQAFIGVCIFVLVMSTPIVLLMMFVGWDSAERITGIIMCLSLVGIIWGMCFAYLRG